MLIEQGDETCGCPAEVMAMPDQIIGLTDWHSKKWTGLKRADFRWSDY